MTMDVYTINRKTGYLYLVILTILLICGELLFFLFAESDPEEVIVKVFLISVPLIFVYFGKKWAKWTSSIILFLYGILSIIGSFYLEISLLWTVGVIEIFFGVILHTSKKVKTIFLKRNLNEEHHDEIELQGKTQELDNPYLLSRVKASMIDGLLNVVFIILMIFVLPESEYELTFKISTLIIVLFYEPIMLSIFSATLGHKIMSIKVRRKKDINQKINLFQGLIRITVKLLLGWLSFLTINFNDDHRAIHDYLSSSVVIKN